MQLLEGMLFGESFTCFVNEYNIHLRDTLLEVAERSEKMMTRISFAGRLLSQCRCCRNSTRILLVFLSNLSTMMDNGLLVFFLSNLVNDHFLFSTGNCSCINAASLQLRPQTNLLPFFLVPQLHSQILSETTLNTELFCYQSILGRSFIPVIVLFF